MYLAIASCSGDVLSSLPQDCVLRVFIVYLPSLSVKVKCLPVDPYRLRNGSFLYIYHSHGLLIASQQKILAAFRRETHTFQVGKAIVPAKLCHL